MRFDKVQMQGKFWIERSISTARHKDIVDEGRVMYASDTECLYFGTDSDWVKVAGQYDVFTPLTTMLFGKYPLPPGWNINVKEDIIVHMTITSSEVGNISGNWVITGADVQGTHRHGGVTGPATDYVVCGSNHNKGRVLPLASHTHSIQQDGLHTHTFDGTWRPQYIKLVEGVLSS